MRSFQWTVLRRFSYYKKVSTPEGFKIVKPPKKEPVDLAKLIDARIRAGGPITVADYMKMVLTNPDAGYYMQKDVIGQKGDFVTSPEITQLFGEIISAWILHELFKLSNPRPLQFIELGPGKGTLMKDVLRCFRFFKNTTDVSVHLVEVSPILAETQARNLCEDCNAGVGMMPERGVPFFKSGSTSDDIPVYWYKKIEHVPKGFSVILAHEFFDALPVHKYQKTENGWREVLIDSKRDENNEIKLQYTLSQGETPISQMLLKKNEPREHVEVCPGSGVIVKHIADRLEKDGGFALIVDYGHDGEKTDTFRAFKKHQLHDPLSDPGTADLTADVDFSFLREIMQQKMVTLGPVDQGEFLERLGIKTRLDMLLKHAKEEQKEQLVSGYHMIVDKDKMGSRFKCFAAFPLVLKEYLEKYPVAGFVDDPPSD